MKTNFNVSTLSLIAIALSSILLTACSSDDDQSDLNTNQKSIAETVATTANLSLLNDALKQTGLDKDLDNPSSKYALLAPTNEAFTALLGQLGLNSITEVNNETLSQVLKNHLLDGPQTTFYLSPGYKKTLANGPDNNALSLYISTSTDLVFNGQSKAIPNNIDIEVSNGVIHHVDAVITPPNLLDHLRANPDFSSLAAAAERVSDALTEAFNQGGPYTIFAPDNDAFSLLITELGIGSLDAIDDETLIEILLYHVIPGRNLLASGLKDGQVLTNLMDENLKIVNDAWGTAVIQGDYETFAYFHNMDIQATNGVIIPVSGVLLPKSLRSSE